ncbi:hypothetical protein [Hymenobacter koreensis]|uniref:Carboxypeptidase regulatory-like domain-containing protein n=1 Tax=Hymenobacter koreensis TaxID=1084523 RepID=A0ABP8JJ38_9BACT
MTPPPYYLVVAWLALAGCRKNDGPTLLEGQVVDRATGRPVAGAWAQLQAQPGSGGVGGYQPAGDRQACDAQGRFSFAAEPPGGHLIVMAGSAQGHFSSYGEVPAVRAGRRNRDLRVPVQAPAWLRVRLTDEPPASRVWLFVGGFGLSSANHISIALPRDTTVLRPIVAGQDRRIVWHITDIQAVKREYSREVNVPALDTLTLDIRF